MDQVQLLDILKSFTLEDLRELCLHLGFDFEDLESGGKRMKVLDLIDEMKKRNRYEDLVAKARNVKPEAFAGLEAGVTPLDRSPRHFETGVLREIHSLLLDTGFDDLEAQENLFVGMNAAYRAGLPVGNDPASRLWQRLGVLNATDRLPDGELPIETFLANAVHFSGPGPESSQLERMQRLLYAPRPAGAWGSPRQAGHDPEKPDIAAVRELLLQAFAEPDELRRFCLDRPDFRRLVRSFGSGGVDEMVDKVIDFCRTQLMWRAFLGEVEAYTPRLYERFRPRL